MLAVHDEPACLHRSEALEAPAHPIRGRERLECEIACERARNVAIYHTLGNGGDQCAQRWFVRLLAEMQRQRPACVGVVLRDLGNRDGDCLSVANLGQRILDSAGDGNIGRHACDKGSAIVEVCHDERSLGA